MAAQICMGRRPAIVKGLNLDASIRPLTLNQGGYKC
jgi:hypothetical protein